MNRSFSLLRTFATFATAGALLASSIAVAAPTGLDTTKATVAKALPKADTAGKVGFSQKELVLASGSTKSLYARTLTSSGGLLFKADATSNLLHPPPPTTDWLNLISGPGPNAKRRTTVTAVPALVDWSGLQSVTYVSAAGTVESADPSQAQKKNLKLLRISVDREVLPYSTGVFAQSAELPLHDFLRSADSARVVGEVWIAVEPKVLEFLLFNGAPAFASVGSSHFSLKMALPATPADLEAVKAKFGFWQITVPVSVVLAFRKYKPVWSDSTKTTLTSFADDPSPSK